jgi:hypothetical protein
MSLYEVNFATEDFVPHGSIDCHEYIIGLHLMKERATMIRAGQVGIRDAKYKFLT